MTDTPRRYEARVANEALAEVEKQYTKFHEMSPSNPLVTNFSTRPGTSGTGSFINSLPYGFMDEHDQRVPCYKCGGKTEVRYAGTCPVCLICCRKLGLRWDELAREPMEESDDGL